MNTQRIAIVYDWMDKWGGVERVLLTLHEMFPQARFYTSFVDEKAAPWTRGLDVTVSFMQTLPAFIKRSRILSLPFFSYAFESMNFSGFDLVISVSSSFAKGVIVRPPAKHILYLLTPTRFLWNDMAIYTKKGLLAGPGALMAEQLRRWDYIAAQRPDSIISISRTVAERCRTYYGRESDVIYPPFDVAYWRSIAPQKRKETQPRYYLIVSRLEPYKNVSAAIAAFNMRQQDTLIIVGKGSQTQALRRKAGPNIRFYEDISDEQLASLYAGAEALIMMQEEDFGYVALEAIAAGCPVITYAKGGASETVIDGKTGIYMHGNEPTDLLNALDIFHTVSYNIHKKVREYDPDDVFSMQSFKRRFRSLITN